MAAKHAKQRQPIGGIVFIVAIMAVLALVAGLIVWQLPTVLRPATPEKVLPVSSSSSGGDTTTTTTTRKVTTTTTHAAKTYVLSRPVNAPPVILQNPELPTGCEATAATMLLQAYGYSADKMTVANALPKSAFEMYAGRGYAAHPEDAYIGDPRSAGGIGVFAPALCKTVQQMIDRENGIHRAKDVTGTDEEDLLRYVDKGAVICTWATMYMSPLTDAGGWYIKKGDTYTEQYYKWPGNEHCMLLIGHDDTTVTVHDPLRGKCQYDRTVFFQRYADLGKQAIVLIQPKEDGGKINAEN